MTATAFSGPICLPQHNIVESQKTDWSHQGWIPQRCTVGTKLIQPLTEKERQWNKTHYKIKKLKTIKNFQIIH